MSGGVDSAVAAALAVDAGHDVTGVHLALSPDRQTLRSGARGCCSVEDAHDARRVADELGIPFYVWDLADRFREDVVDDFVAEYAAGRTPNPCLRCNEKIKFSAVLDRALALGFDAVVTGHHARLVRRRAAPLGRRGQGPVLRARRADRRSSWPPRCSRSASMTKERVREIAAERGLRRRRQARLARHLLHPRRRHPRLPGPAAGQPARPGRRRGHRRDRRRARRHLRVHRRAAQGARGQRRRPAAALRARHRAGQPHGDDRDGGPRRASPRCAPARPTWTGPAPGAAVRAREVQLRAHAHAGGVRGATPRTTAGCGSCSPRSSAASPPGSPRCSTSRTPMRGRPGARAGRRADARVNGTKRFVTRLLASRPSRRLASVTSRFPSVT